MAKRNGINSVDEMAKLHQRLEAGIPPSYPLEDKPMAVYKGIIDSLPLDNWDPARVRLATQLAQLIIYNENNLQALMEEGPTLINERGTPIANPLQSAMNQTQNTIQSMMRTLGLSASQRGVSETNKAAGMNAQKEANNAIKKAKDDLLA